MNPESLLVFPALIELNEFDGNFKAYYNAVYAIFEDHFIKKQPSYNGLSIAVRKYPEVDGLHRTFYHITHHGEDESNREPDIRRMERIRFPNFLLANNEHSEILIWKNKRGRDDRILLFNKAENYIVVLTERNDFYMFITAYCVETEHRKRKLLKEHQEYIKAKTA